MRNIRKFHHNKLTKSREVVACDLGFELIENRCRPGVTYLHPRSDRDTAAGFSLSRASALLAATAVAGYRQRHLQSDPAGAKRDKIYSRIGRQICPIAGQRAALSG